MPWVVAGALYVARGHGWAAVRAVAPGPGDTVVVAGIAYVALGGALVWQDPPEEAEP